MSVTNPVTYLSQQQKGAFADVYFAGNIGYGVLKQFNVTFDYPRQQIFFEKNADYGPTGCGRSLRNVAGAHERGFEVVDVVVGSAADEAGIKAGDVIVAIDGKAASSWQLSDARERLKAARERTSGSASSEPSRQSI